MADQWLLNRLEQAKTVKSGGGAAPTPRPIQTSRQVSPQVQAPVAQQPVAPKRKIFDGNFIQDAFDLVRIPEYAQASFVEGGANYAKSKNILKDAPFQHISEIPNVVAAGIKAIPEGVKGAKEYGREEGNFNIGKEMGIKNELAQTAVNFATSLNAPNVPLGVVTKATGLNKLGSKIMGKTANVLRKTEPIAKAIETFNPYFRNPEMGKLVKAAEERTQGRLNKLYQTITRVTKDLKPGEQARIGQILEGGVTTNPKYAEIAKEIGAISDEVGEQAVRLGLLKPEVYQQFKGNYMTHIWNELSQKGTASDLFTNRKVVPQVSGQFFKKRKGAEGYIKEFGPAVMKGLGTEIRDIEKATLLKQIANRYGKKAEELVPTENMGSMLVNELLKNSPKVRKGLGEAQKGFVSPDEIGPELLKVFQEYQPARKKVGEGIGMGVEAVAKNVRGGNELFRARLNPTEAKLFARTIWGDEEKERVYSYVMQSMGYAPTQGNLEVFLNKVGKLPDIKKSKLKLALDPLVRDIPDGFNYAPKELTSTKTGKLLENVALPGSVIDTLNKTTKTSSPNLLDKVTNAWKKGKTIYNPAYHVRNKVSNQVLSDMSTGDGLVKTVAGDVVAGRELSGKGNQAFVEAARQVGLIDRKDMGEMFSDTLEVAGMGKKRNILQKTDDALTGFQSKQENTSKLNVFKSWINKYAKEEGKSVEEALTDSDIIRRAKVKAEEAIFSPYNINKAERATAGKIVPFYSFVRQAVPFTAKTYMNNPERLTKYDKFKTAVEGLSPEGTAQNKDLPEYAKGTIRLPIKDKNGNYYRVDPQYILPYGQIGPGDVERGQLPFGMGINPYISEAAQQVFNKDLYFGNDIRTSNQRGKSAKQTVEHAARSLLPTLYTSIGYPATNVLPGGDVPMSNGKLYGAYKEKTDYAGRTRSMPSAILDTLGLKNSALDINTQKQFNQREKNLRRKAILQEISSIRRDKRYDAEEKKKQIKILQEQLKEFK